MTWQDIDLKEQCLTVRRSMRYNGTRHKLEVGATKRKKIRTVDFCNALADILQQAKREISNRSIMIKTRSGYQLTRLSDILFIERSNRKNHIVTTDGQEISLLGYTMNQLEEMLEGCGFYRCYQSFIVNLSQVAAVRADNDAKIYTIRFKDYEGEILLSREKYAELVALLKGRYAKINI